MGSSGSSGIGNKRNLDLVSQALGKSFEKLSSGKRINRASDDAAGLAIAEKLASDAVVFTQGSRNISDAQSLTDIKDSVSGSLSEIGTRLQELATQSSNGTLSDSQRQSLDQEFQQLTQEANRIVGSTQFNGKNVFDGDATQIQVGNDSSSNSQIAVPDGGTAAAAASLSSLSIANQDSARSAIDSLSSFISNIGSSRGEIGAVQSRLEVANRNNQSAADTARAAESRIRDADIADETAKLTANSIRQQGATALFAQAGKLNAQVVQSLLT